MKALLLSIDDTRGGAARAAYRLHQGLQGVGVASQMLVQYKFSDDPTVIAPSTKLKKGIAQIKPTLDGLPLRLYKNRGKTVFSSEWVPDTIGAKLSQLNPDILNLHWVCDGFLRIETLAKVPQPLVWTLHDMWAFTGGCHYSQDCDRYHYSCGACPQLKSTWIHDLSYWIWQRKVRAWKDLNLNLVAPSYWLAECARSSALFKDVKIEVIPNGLDTQRYKPIEQSKARDWLNLPQDVNLLLFGAVKAISDPRKGFHLLQSALQIFSQSQCQKTTELVIVGASKPHEPIDWGLKTHYLGILKDDISLALAYAAADVFVAPSIQENLSNTVMESLSCGTPCVAFKIGGMPDLVDHEKNGYLAQPFDLKEFAYGISWILQDKDRCRKLSAHGREKVEREFTLSLQAQRYQNLFQHVISLQNSKAIY